MTACPSCGGSVADGDQFCEACGATVVGAAPGAAATTASDAAEPGSSGTHLLPPPGREAVAAPPRACTSCGGAVDADGWCTECGLRATSERDHTTEQAAPNVAGVCDKGRVHPRNEDAMALAASGGRVVLVVCDGVSSSTDSDVASLGAARAARDILDRAGASAADDTDGSIAFWTAALGRAVEAAQVEATAAAATVGAKDNPPSSTFVAAVVDGPLLVSGWVGDSRCYWFGDDGTAVQVSIDDSWATAQVAEGIDRDAAEADPRAHSITRWLGADSPGGPPTCAAVAVGAGGWLLVCSDGLWNYCSEPADLGRRLADTVEAHGAEPLAVASALCDWANEQGGHDNITVTLAHLAPTPSPVTPSASATTAPTDPPATEQPA